MLVQDRPLVASLTVDDALADLRLLKTRSQSSSSEQDTGSAARRSKSKGILALGRQILAASGSGDTPALEPVHINDLASFDAALEVIAAAVPASQAGASAQTSHARADAAAVAAARYYIAACKACLRFNGTPLHEGEMGTGTASASASKTSRIDEMHKQVAEMQARTDEAAAQLRQAIQRLQAFSAR